MKNPFVSRENRRKTVLNGDDPIMAFSMRRRLVNVSLNGLMYVWKQRAKYVHKSYLMLNII